MYAVVLVAPEGKFVSVLHGSFVVLCIDTSSIQINSIEWLVNGSPLENLNLNARTDFSMGGIGILRITNLQSKHNNSNIRCKVNTTDSEIITSADSSELIIQG